jgi:Transposase Tn5 dimerisation domain
MIPHVLANPEGTITGALDDDPAAVKAAYRLLDCDRVTHQAVLAPHRQVVADTLAMPGTYLLIEDTTSITPASDDAWGLGPVDNQGRTSGFWLHSTLAARLDFADGLSDRNTVDVIGLLDQQAWAREEQKKPRKESREQRLARPRESARWAGGLVGIKPSKSALRIYVADRESDIWEVFGRCAAAGVSWVIRAAQDRALADEGGRVREAVEAMPVRETRLVELPRSQGEPSRIASLQLRYGRLEFNSPYRPGQPAGSNRMSMNVVHLREIGAPQGVKPVEWLLLTDLPVESVEDGWRVVAIYKRRWLIEEFHKGLKTGAGMEHSQLSTAGKLMAWCAVLSVVTTWLLRQKLRCALPEQPPLKPQDADADLIALLEKRRGCPKEGWTAKTLTHAIARAGGFLGRKSDGNPGWLTLWRGWTRLYHQLIGYRLAMAEKRCG